MYLIVGKGTFTKQQLSLQLLDWGYEDPDDIVNQIDKIGSVKLDNNKICKFK